MNSAKKITYLNFGFIAVALLTGFALKNQLPEMIPSHFDVNGEADKFAPRASTLVFIPFIAIFSSLIINFLTKADKIFFVQEKNQQAVAETNLAITTLLLIIYAGQLLIGLNPNTMKNFSFFAFAFGTFFILCVSPMKKMSRNKILGIRAPWTMISEEIWSQTHHFAAKIMLPLGLVLIVASPLTKSPLIIFGIIGISFILPIFYAYKLCKKLKY